MGKLRVGIMGCGGRGQSHALGYRQSDQVVLAACADTHRPAAERMAQNYGVQAIYTDYREMLARERLDIVSMCLWPALHCEAVLACLEAPVLPRLINAEKPMAPIYGEAVRMHEACLAAGVPLTFSHQRRFGPHFAKARDLLAEGAIGTLQRLEMDCPNLLDWGTHWFDMMLFYNQDLDPDWVLGQIGCVDDERVFGARMETAGLAYVKWPNHVTGLLTTGHGTGAPVTIRALGSKGMMDVDHGKVMLLREGQAWERVAVPARPVPGDDTTLHLLDSIACILEGRESILCSRNALRTTQLIFGTYESARRRARVVLPLKIDDSPLLSMLEKGQMRIPDWPAFLTEDEERQGFELLFDGHRLQRWQSVPSGAWAVAGGILRGGYEGAGGLRTRRRFTDVLVRCEFRLGSRGRAALVLRADATGRGIEIPLFDDRWEPRERTSTGGLAGRVAPVADGDIGASRWNWLVASLKGTALSVSINGKQTLACDLRDHPDLAALASGPLVLRAEVGPFDVRNVMVRQPD
jgi:predicted dehydrogenase